jgi:hypothetical protein
MHHPDEKTPENTPAPAANAIPVEKLVDSMKPETPLVIESGKGGFGSGGGVGAAGSSTTSTAVGTANGSQP